MRCPRCLNTDKQYFYKGSKGWYCRKCISFGRAMLEEEQEAVSLAPISEGSEEYVLQYPLTPLQAEVSHRCAELIQETNVLLHCVCGAGKTELVVESIAQMLRQKKHVCFAIPRRQVVLELEGRLKQYFPYAKVTAVCGGRTGDLTGDVIVCTTHQLFRPQYRHAFDLLILDEPDAFPFRGNEVLHGIAETACRGTAIYLTATPDDWLKTKLKNGTLQCLKLNRRPHGHDLPVPVIKTAPTFVLLILLVRWLKHHASPRMIFVPTIREAKLLHRFLKQFMDCFCCTSKTENRDEVIELFRKTRNGIIVSTTILERGVTVPGCDVCVFHADHGVFDEAGLIQMAGRAGRTFQYPDGDVLFLTSSRSALAEQCRKEIQEANLCAA